MKKKYLTCPKPAGPNPVPRPPYAPPTKPYPRGGGKLEFKVEFCEPDPPYDF